MAMDVCAQAQQAQIAIVAGSADTFGQACVASLWRIRPHAGSIRPQVPS
jgi:hypothetical protein